MRIAVGADHAGFKRKARILAVLAKMGHEVRDAECGSEESCDYPDYAARVARDVSEGRADRGVLVCGTGIGMAMAANKFPGVRAAVCWNVRTAVLASEHNGANVMCLSAKMLSQSLTERMLLAWLKTPFAGGRHERRVGKISDLERSCKPPK